MLYCHHKPTTTTTTAAATTTTTTATTTTTTTYSYTMRLKGLLALACRRALRPQDLEVALRFDGVAIQLLQAPDVHVKPRHAAWAVDGSVFGINTMATNGPNGTIMLILNVWPTCTVTVPFSFFTSAVARFQEPPTSPSAERTSGPGRSYQGPVDRTVANERTERENVAMTSDVVRKVGHLEALCWTPKARATKNAGVQQEVPF